MRFLIQLILKITNSNNSQVCGLEGYIYIHTYYIYIRLYNRLPFFNLSWNSYSLATSSFWSGMLNVLIVEKVSCFRRDCSLFCTWPIISFYLWLWKNTVTAHSGDSVVCRGHTWVYFFHFWVLYQAGCGYWCPEMETLLWCFCNSRRSSRRLFSI